MIHVDLIIKFLILLASANGAPVLARRFFGNHLSHPIDAGVILSDGQPVFGTSKTIRGLVAAVGTTTIIAPTIGLSSSTGFAIACLAMAGDLISSFIKRRRSLSPSSKATGLDQIPESLIPALAGIFLLELSVLDVLAILILFFVLEKIISQLLYKLRIRKHPY